jgi:hypothetical protein
VALRRWIAWSVLPILPSTLPSPTLDEKHLLPLSVSCCANIDIIGDLQLKENAIQVFRNRWDALLNTFTMLLGKFGFKKRLRRKWLEAQSLSFFSISSGEVDGGPFKGSGFAVALFIVFVFLVDILLANVLIAIVTDSFKVIQDQCAAIVFWTDRLAFIAQMDAIANGPGRSFSDK